jgi:hypothetical protein
MKGTLPQVPRLVGELLARHGWKAGRDRPSRWRRTTPAGPAVLWADPAAGGWEEWSLQGGAVPAAADLLAANARLPGPGKLVRSAQGGCLCRFDLPRDLADAGAPADLPEGGHPLDSWLRDVTAVAGGSPAEPVQPGEAPDALAARLEKAGWAAAAAEGKVRLSISLPGLFRQAVLDGWQPAGTRLWCELADLAGAAEPCRQAVLRLAGEANGRLRLVRFALVPAGAAEVLAAEVNLGSAGVPGPWLEWALEALHTAVVLTARELSALRGDPELARWFLAATAAQAKEE